MTDPNPPIKIRIIIGAAAIILLIVGIGAFMRTHPRYVNSPYDSR